ncbi:hypothetical protein ACOME3_005224 [Neoechinorhynchus agilis]
MLILGSQSVASTESTHPFSESTLGFLTFAAQLKVRTYTNSSKLCSKILATMEPNVESSLENELSTTKKDISRNAFISPTIDATDADTLNDPLIVHSQPEKTNATELQRVSTLVCSVCDKSFKLTNLGVLFANGP